MGFPAPDLAFTNNTPYGIMIWTSYTDTSLTITLYSTPHARGEQTPECGAPEGHGRPFYVARAGTRDERRHHAGRYRLRQHRLFDP